MDPTVVPAKKEFGEPQYEDTTPCCCPKGSMDRAEGCCNSWCPCCDSCCRPCLEYACGFRLMF